VDDGVDLIIDFIGKNYFNSNLNLLRRDGTMVFLAFMSGPVLPPDTNLIQLLFKRLTLKGSTLRSRTAEYQRDLLRRFEENALPLIKKGKMRVEVHEVFPWEKVVDAHKEMEANKNSGKVRTCPCIMASKLKPGRLCSRSRNDACMHFRVILFDHPRHVNHLRPSIRHPL